MFSVLMSLYNKEKPSFLYECLKSLQLQTLQASEIIIVYDGEIGNDLNKVVDSFSHDLPIVKVKLNKNMGLGRALKVGLQHCTNEIIARMDTDDICYPERFAKQIPRMINNKDLVLSGSAIIEFDEDKNERIKLLPQTTTEIKKFSKIKNPFNHMTVVFRKSAINNVGSYRHHLYMEDYNLWLRLIANGYQCENLDHVLVEARVGKEMIARRRGIRYLESELILFKLKLKLKITGFCEGLLIFIIRAAPRILPSQVLYYLYKKDRRVS